MTNGFYGAMHLVKKRGNKRSGRHAPAHWSKKIIMRSCSHVVVTCSSGGGSEGSGCRTVSVAKLYSPASAPRQASREILK